MCSNICFFKHIFEQHLYISTYLPDHQVLIDISFIQYRDAKSDELGEAVCAIIPRSVLIGQKGVLTLVLGILSQLQGFLCIFTHFLYYFFQGSKYICANSYYFCMSDPVFNRLFRLHTSPRLQKKFSLLVDQAHFLFPLKILKNGQR